MRAPPEMVKFFELRADGLVFGPEMRFRPGLAAFSSAPQSEDAAAGNPGSGFGQAGLVQPLNVFDRDSDFPAETRVCSLILDF